MGKIEDIKKVFEMFDSDESMETHQALDKIKEIIQSKEKTLTDFADDKEKMIDFKEMPKDAFLQSYSYITEEEYELTLNKINEKKLKFEDDLECPKCKKVEPVCGWTYLKEGFNGIKKGDKDDLDKLECNWCGHIIEYPELEDD